MMDRETITNRFQHQIGDDQVVAALFTTYNFEPEFFEQEIIPLMLKQDVAFSSDARVKSVQVREVLNGNPLPIEVFYDRDIFWRDSRERRSPAMEYLHHGIRGDRGAFHAKLILLLLEGENEEQYLKVAAGSANLTNAGWWENVEAQHWETVLSGKVKGQFLKTLKNDIRWLAEKVGKTSGSALDLISGYLGGCRGANTMYEGDPVYYYGLSSVEEYRKTRGSDEPFLKFLIAANLDAHTYPAGWSLEIVSPYFAESNEFSPEETIIQRMGVSDIRIFLPKNDQNEGVCRQDYYQKISETPSVSWALWTKEYAQKLGLNSSAHRRTHAKIYHFYKGRQSWVFIGSVNFTHKAFSDNQEAGFFVKLARQVVLLEETTHGPNSWADPDDDSEALNTDDAEALPSIELGYDWKVQRLTARWPKQDGSIIGDSLSIVILDPERRTVAEAHGVGNGLANVEVSPVAIEQLLRHSGFLMVTGHYSPGHKPFPAHAVMVQQTNWTHKPLDLPNLTPQEILQIYASLSEVRRIEIIERLKSKQLADRGLTSEYIGVHQLASQEREFFAEYAELFYAFRKLRERLLSLDACDPCQARKLDYYLSGRGLDSLPVLFESLFDKDARLDKVTVYLALLCLIDIYQQPTFSARGQVESNLSKCRDEVERIEGSEDIHLIDNEPDRTRRFFSWYRNQFFRAYKPLESEAADDTR